MGSEQFKGSHETTIRIGFWVVAGLLMGLWENKGFNIYVLEGVMLGFLGMLFLYVGDFLTYTLIRDDKRLINRFGYESPYVLDIAKIVRIDRGAVFKLKHWGSRLEIWYLDDEGKEAVRTIQESAYSGETIQKLVARLKELNPNINLDPQYQDLIDGKIDPKKFKKIDPTHH